MAPPAIEYEALGFDPAPGDASGVGELAERYRRISTKLKSAAEALDAIASRTGLWEGVAAEAFFSNIHRLPEYLGLAIESTAAASAALDGWATALDAMQGKAYELEMRARKAQADAQAARADPAMDLVFREFFDPESLGAAQRLLDAAQARLSAAIDTLNGIQAEAERLLAEHTEAAERTAQQLEQARELAPDQPRGGIGGIVDDVSDSLGNAVEDARGFVAEHANRIEAVSGFVSDVSSVVGLAADLEIPFVSQGLGIASVGLDALALGGLAAADLGGASVSGEQYRQTGISLASGGVGILPGVQGTVVEEVVNQVGNFGGGPYEPRNERQSLQLALSFLPQGAPLRHAVAAENMISDFGDWGEEWREAEEADRAAAEERGGR
jgi:hypothetical protein